MSVMNSPLSFRGSVEQEPGLQKLLINWVGSTTHSFNQSIKVELAGVASNTVRVICPNQPANSPSCRHQDLSAIIQMPRQLLDHRALAQRFSMTLCAFDLTIYEVLHHLRQ
jgi:hypothetical protein